MLEIDDDLKEFLNRQIQPQSVKKTTTASPSKHREHNHFPQGKTGYNPRTARLANHDKPKRRGGS